MHKNCNVKNKKTDGINEDEISQVTIAVQKLGLKFVVITSPARDDFDDSGVLQFYNDNNNLIKG